MNNAEAIDTMRTIQKEYDGFGLTWDEALMRLIKLGLSPPLAKDVLLTTDHPLIFKKEE